MDIYHYFMVSLLMVVYITIALLVLYDGIGRTTKDAWRAILWPGPAIAYVLGDIYVLFKDVGKLLLLLIGIKIK